jgi:hypothetical protein
MQKNAVENLMLGHLKMSNIRVFACYNQYIYVAQAGTISFIHNNGPD